MRVCIVTSVHAPFDSRIFHKQARSLVKAGYEVSIVAQHNKEEVVKGIRIVPLPRRRSRWRRVLGTFRVFRVAHSQRADVYHFHDPELLPVGFLLTIVTKARVIYDVHEDYREQILSKHWIPRMLRRPVSLIFGLLEDRVSRRLDLVVTATEGISRRFGKEAVVVMNYPLLERFQASRTASSGSPVFIYVGSLTEIRGISEVVQAMACLDRPEDAKLRLYGTFSPESYGDTVRALSGSERTECMGWVAPEDAWSLMTQATAGIVCSHPLKSHLDSMPVKMFEYMAAGIPVIASNFPLWVELIEGDGCGITVDPLQPRDIARAIQYFIDYPDVARKMGENARRAALEKYSWESEQEKLLAVYADLVWRRELQPD